MATCLPGLLTKRPSGPILGLRLDAFRGAFDLAKQTCLNCGIEFDKKPGKGRHAVFHATSCRKAWNNRRAVRGAELYDIWMLHRYDREAGKEANTLTIMANLARAYHDADEALREGRASYDREAIKRLPLAYGSSGDKR